MNAAFPSTAEVAAFLAGFPIGAVLIDNQGCVAAVNPVFSELTGLSAEQLVGADQQAFDRHLVQRADSTLPYRPCWKAPVTAKASANSDCSHPAGSGHCQCDFQIAQPTWRRLRRSMSPGPCGAGTVLWFQDISREARLDQLKSEFLITAAHELRTPLTMIMGYAEMLLMSEFDELESSRVQRSLFRQCKNLAGLLDDVLDLARLEGTQQPLARKPVDLGQLALIACGQYQPETDTRRPHVRIGSAAAQILADAQQVTKCIHHLLDNAYRYSFGQGEITVRVDIDPADAWPMIEVSDEGIGMTAEQVSNAFERFWRGDPSGKLPGSGLGLSIVREVMRRHGGVAGIRSTPAHGTAVTLRFPPLPRGTVTFMKDAS